jgi:hypothetical protein
MAYPCVILAKLHAVQLCALAIAVDQEGTWKRWDADWPWMALRDGQALLIETPIRSLLGCKVGGMVSW